MDDAEDPSVILVTRRLVLRYQSASDVPFLTDLWADPVVTRYMGGPRDREWLRSAFEETARNPRAERYDLWPVAERGTGQLVGHCGLLDKEVDGRMEVELSYVISPALWGRGYATEVATGIKQFAAERMGLRRLIALIAPENVASERVALKVGMLLEKETVRPGGARRRLYVWEDREERPAEGGDAAWLR